MMEMTLTQILEEVSIGNLSPKNAREKIITTLRVDQTDVDDWLGLKHGVWYHPTIELLNYTNEENPKSYNPLLAELISDCYNELLIKTSMSDSERIDDLLCPQWIKTNRRLDTAQAKKDRFISILESRIETAFDNGYYRYENDMLRTAIESIKALVPPEAFAVE